ncbi:glycosyltransferase family 4 protein [Paenibacillus gansuensis]|uniref:Glycosyltransferase family 1 protein n=1 Tax=Paenibacillus gansuensis TaxID=306542 RepID=A0ABW5PI19_9BACL
MASGKKRKDTKTEKQLERRKKRHKAKGKLKRRNAGERKKKENIEKKTGERAEKKVGKIKRKARREEAKRLELQQTNLEERGTKRIALEGHTSPTFTPIRFQTPHPAFATRLLVPSPATNMEAAKVGKVLHLPSNPAGQMSTQALALRALGVPVSFVTYSSSNRYGYPVDLPSPLNGVTSSEQDAAMMTYAMEAAHEYDLFHFHSGQTFTYTSYAYTDLPYLNLFKKKMVMSFWGSEIRRLSIAKKNNPFARARILDEKEILERLHVLSHYMNAVIAPDYEMYEYLRGYFKRVYLVRQAVEPRNYSPLYPVDSKRPLVVHAPSHTYIKGTEYLVQAVERLKKSVDFDYIQVENMPHAEAVKIYQKADIIVDQLCLGIYSIFPIEAMLLGKPVITFIRDDLRKTYPSDLPIVSANPLTIQDTLHGLLTNPLKRYHLGIRGRQYALKHHNPETIARQLVSIYNRL